MSAPEQQTAEKASQGHGPESDGEALTRAEKRLLIGLGIAGAVVVVIVLAIKMLGGDDDPTKAEQGTAENAPELSDGTIVEAPAVMSPTTDPVADDLARADLAGGPLDWALLGDGSWSVDDGVLRSSSEPADANPLAVVAVPDELGDGWAFSISVETPAQNAGFIWGVVDENNYWELRSNQQYAAVVINRVEDGETTQVKIIGPSGLAEGQRYTLAHQGETITIAEGGEPFLTVSDESLAKPRQVGVIASTDAPAGFTEPELAAIVDD